MSSPLPDGIYRLRETHHQLFATRIYNGSRPGDVPTVEIKPMRSDDRQLWMVTYNPIQGYLIESIRASGEYLVCEPPYRPGASIITSKSPHFWSLRQMEPESGQHRLIAEVPGINHNPLTVSPHDAPFSHTAEDSGNSSIFSTVSLGDVVSGEDLQVTHKLTITNVDPTNFKAGSAQTPNQLWEAVKATQSESN